MQRRHVMLAAEWASSLPVTPSRSQRLRVQTRTARWAPDDAVASAPDRDLCAAGELVELGYAGRHVGAPGTRHPEGHGRRLIAPRRHPAGGDAQWTDPPRRLAQLQPH